MPNKPIKNKAPLTEQEIQIIKACLAHKEGDFGYPDGCTWWSFHIPNVKIHGMNRKQLAGHLATLQDKGWYEADEEYNTMGTIKEYPARKYE